MESAGLLRKRILLVLIAVALVSSLLGVLFTKDLAGLLLNFGTEMAGAVVTYVLLELVIGRKEEQEAKKTELIAQLGSSVNDVAVAAAEELGRRGWLHDGSLQGADLGGSDLQGANLRKADLRKANLSGAKLQTANLFRAELRKANLVEADLQQANLSWADLQGTNMFTANLRRATLLCANLQEADLSGADLSGAMLREANLHRVDLIRPNLQGVDLQGANLIGATISLGEDKLNKNMILPDGTQWTPNTDMARFTDRPEHPEFWRSDEY